MMQPFVKWAGGKRQLEEVLLPMILDRLASSGTYIEPFLGGGAIALAVARERPDSPIVAGDACADLVDAWLAVQQHPIALARELAALGKTHDGDQYYRVRDGDVSDDLVKRAARFIYLNKMGFNGLYRVNRAGRFNVPLGRGKVSAIPTHSQLQALWTVVRDWSIQCSDFEPLIEAAVEGDVVYADPPYDGTFSYSSGFDTVSRRRLMEAVRRAARRGVGVIVTDADTRRVRHLYRWATLVEIGERRRVAASSSSRGDAACVAAVRP